MDKKEEIISQLWNYFITKRSAGDQITIAEFGEGLKKTWPDLSYTDYKERTKIAFEILGRSMDWPFIPDGFEWVARSFIDAIHPSRALIPFSTGLECDWFDNNTSVEYYFPNKNHEQAAKAFVDIKTIEEIPKKGQYDLILSALPLGPINDSFMSCKIVKQTSRLLSEEGYCVFTFSKAITLNQGEKWLSNLEKEGLYCVALFDLPMGSYAPVSVVESEVVVFSKRKVEKRFVGLIAEKSFSDKNVENFLRGEASKNGAKLGAYVDGNIRCYSDLVNASRKQNKNKALAKAYNGNPFRINEIGEVHGINKNNEFQENENAVYVPKLGRSPVVMEVADFQLLAQNYFQIVVNANMVLPRFLAFFLNTEEGVNLRQLYYAGTTIPALNKKALEEMTIPCPPVELQSEYLKTYDQLEILRVDIEKLKDKLQKTPAAYKNIRKEIKNINNTGDKFIQWIETTPYPIATILKRYSVAEDANKRQETLFYFYEAYSIFQATLLSAALNKNLIDSSDIKDVDPSFFEKASFGNWVKMDRALSNLFLGMINSNNEEKKRAALECYKTKDNNLITLICNKNVCNILENASKYRNSWKGHSGLTSDALYKEHADILDSMLHKLQESIKDLYERIRLIRPISLSFSNGVFSNKVEVLTGSNSIFVKDTIKALIPLDNSKLYIQMLDTGEMLELPPYFILKNSPADVKNACYFYSRVEKGSTRYVSYHYDGKPEDIEMGETAYNHIKKLLTTEVLS